MIACDDNAYLQMFSAKAEQDRLWEFMVDLLTGEIVLASEDQQQVNHTPAQTDCTPTQVLRVWRVPAWMKRCGKTRAKYLSAYRAARLSKWPSTAFSASLQSLV
jgi:hypothetical protein